VAYLLLVRLTSNVKGYNHYTDVGCTALCCAGRSQADWRAIRHRFVRGGSAHCSHLGQQRLRPYPILFLLGCGDWRDVHDAGRSFFAVRAHASERALFNYGFLLFVLAEAAIVWIEAIVLQRMTRIRFFRRREVAPLRFGQALGYSLLVNVVSFLFGLVA